MQFYRAIFRPVIPAGPVNGFTIGRDFFITGRKNGTKFCEVHFFEIFS
jgi:hypothetical protein